MWYASGDEADKGSENAKLMSAWMDNYLDALWEMDEQTAE